MSKIVPFQAPGKRRAGKPHTARNQLPPTCRADGEEGMVSIQMKDGTWETISGRSLEMDIAYREGVPYLVVKKSR